MHRADLVTGAAQSGGRPPADGDLRLVQDFVNTLDREHGNDLLDGTDGLAAWLEHRGLDADGLRPRDVARAVEVREALRALLLANNGGPAAPEAHAVLEDAARRAGLAPVFGEAALVPAAGGVDGALGRLVAIVHGAVADGTWAHLKACEREPCRWVFYDHSKNHSGRWCDMQACGAREKSARAYRRRRDRESAKRS